MQMLRQTSKVAPKLADSTNNPCETIPKKGVNMSAKHMPKRFKILSLLMGYIQTSSICNHLSCLYIIGGSPMESRIWGDHSWLQLTCKSFPTVLRHDQAVIHYWSIQSRGDHDTILQFWPLNPLKFHWLFPQVSPFTCSFKLPFPGLLKDAQYVKSEGFKCLQDNCSEGCVEGVGVQKRKNVPESPFNPPKYTNKAPYFNN